MQTMKQWNYETESIDQLSGNDLHDTAQHLTELSQFGMSTEEMAQKTDISPDAIKDILDWYDTDPEDRGAGVAGQ